MKCEDCKFFVMPANERMGSCKRFPQSVNKIHNEWCGEYLRKEIVEDQPIKVEFKSVFPVEVTPDELVDELVQIIAEEKPKRKSRTKKNAD